MADTFWGVALGGLHRKLDRSLVEKGLVHPCVRSEEHTSELQSLTKLVCRLLLEKKKISILLLFLVSAVCKKKPAHSSESGGGAG